MPISKEIKGGEIIYVITEPYSSEECAAFAKCLNVDNIIVLTNDGKSRWDSGVLYLDELSLGN